MRHLAADWHERQGHLEPALEYAMAAEDEELAADLTIRTVQGTMSAGRLETARRCVPTPQLPALTGVDATRVIAL